MAKKEEKDKRENIEKKLLELEDQLKRSVADFQNLEKRVAEERKHLIKYANYELLSSLLPAFDSLFLAEKYIEDEGLKYTVKSVKDALENVGVQRIETEGKDFDASTMDCVETIEGNEGKVLEEVRPGFMLYDKVIRPASVKVGKRKEK